MRETKRVRATGPRVPFPAEKGKYLPAKPKDGEASTMSVPWSPYWRRRLEQGFIEIVEREAVSSVVAHAPVMSGAEVEG